MYMYEDNFAQGDNPLGSVRKLFSLGGTPASYTYGCGV